MILCYAHLFPIQVNQPRPFFRYDCRLYLNDLSEFESGSGAAARSSALEAAADGWDDSLNEAEKVEEELCQEERYKDLCYDGQDSLDGRFVQNVDNSY